MDWEKFMLHAHKNGLLLPTASTYEYGRGDMLLVPLKTPKDPRNIYELVKLVGAYAYPGETRSFRAAAPGAPRKTRECI